MVLHLTLQNSDQWVQFTLFPSILAPTLTLNQSPDIILSQARAAAVTDQPTASRLCMELSQPERDGCFSDIALTAKTKTLCEPISDTSSKDACLANLALLGDFSVCDDITNADIKDSCIALKGKT